jgi:hypothetical protein
MVPVAMAFRGTQAVAMPDHTAASVGRLVMVQPLLWLSGGNTWAFTALGLVMGLASHGRSGTTVGGP